MPKGNEISTATKATRMLNTTAVHSVLVRPMLKFLLTRLAAQSGSNVPRFLPVRVRETSIKKMFAAAVRDEELEQLCCLLPSLIK